MKKMIVLNYVRACLRSANLKRTLVCSRLFAALALMAVVTVLAGCSGDDDDFVVSRTSVYGDWTAKEVNVDGTWIDAKKAKQTFHITLTDDGYWVTASEPYPYEVKEKSVECYDEKKSSILRIIRFTSLSGNTATAKVSWPSSGKSIEARMVRDASKYYCRAPYEYLIGVWDIVKSDIGGTVTFDGGYAEVKYGDIEVKGSYGRSPTWAVMSIIYPMNGAYWEERNPYFVVEVQDEDAHVDSIVLRGCSGYRQYEGLYLRCAKR